MGTSIYIAVVLLVVITVAVSKMKHEGFVYYFDIPERITQNCVIYETLFDAMGDKLNQRVHDFSNIGELKIVSVGGVSIGMSPKNVKAYKKLEESYVNLKRWPGALTAWSNMKRSQQQLVLKIDRSSHGRIFNRRIQKNGIRAYWDVKGNGYHIALRSDNMGETYHCFEFTVK